MVDAGSAAAMVDVPSRDAGVIDPPVRRTPDVKDSRAPRRVVSTPHRWGRLRRRQVEQAGADQRGGGLDEHVRPL